MFPWTVPLKTSCSPKYFHTFSTTLPNLVLARLFAVFFNTAPSAMAGNLFSGIVHTVSYFAISTFSRLYLLEVGTFLGSALNVAVLLVVLEDPTILSAAVICTVSILFCQLRVPFLYFSCML